MFKELTDLYNKQYEYSRIVEEMCRNAYAVAFDVQDHDDMCVDDMPPTDCGMLNWDELTIGTSYSPPVSFVVGSNGNNTFVRICCNGYRSHLSVTEEEFMDPDAFAGKIRELAGHRKSPSISAH